MTTRRFNPYQAYKDSGIEWLGEIPAGWEVRRADSFLRYDKIQIEPSEISGDLAFHYSIPAVQETGDGALEAPSQIDSAKLRVVGNRLLVSKLNPRKGVVLIASEHDVPTICSTEFVPFEVRGCELRWALYLFLAESTRQRLSAVVRSATRSHQRAEVSEIVKIWHGVPSVPEQRTIAAFLDRETARTDALVAKKERLIELLQEQCTALITRAVTNGLDPTVPMMDSGVEWLGEIPAHWEVRRLKFLLAAPLKYGANEAAELDDPDLPRYVRITDIDESDGLRDDTFKSLPVDVAEEYLLREGDLLFARSGATAGKTFLYRRSWGTCAYAGYLIRARLDTNRASPEFVRYFTASTGYWQWLSAVFVQATIQNVSAEKYASLVMPQPPYPEQRTIVTFLDRETARIDTLVAKVREAIDRLKELRTALISAAVTGKIDVREKVA